MADKRTKQEKTYRVMTVRLPLAVFKNLKKVRAKREKAELRVVPYTEILLRQIREMKPEDVPSRKEAQRSPDDCHVMTFRFSIDDLERLKRLKTEASHAGVKLVTYQKILLTGLRSAS